MVLKNLIELDGSRPLRCCHTGNAAKTYWLQYTQSCKYLHVQLN